MLRRPTSSPSTRRLAPKAPTRGPSWTRRTSWTWPALRPPSSTTSAPSRSLRRMAGSRQVADEVVAGPGLELVGLQLGLGHAQVDGALDPLDHAEGDAGGAPVVAAPEAVGDRLQPRPGAAADPAAERPRAGQDGRHHRRAAAPGDLQLEVVDLAGQAAVGVDQLAVQQVQPGFQDAAAHGRQLPALVRTIRGIVATATTSRSSRYSEPSALENREFTLSPM